MMDLDSASAAATSNNTGSISVPSAGLSLSSFTYNESESHFVVLFGTFLTVASTVSVIARLYSRYFIANQLGWDDLMAVGALVGAPFPWSIGLILTTYTRTASVLPL